MIPETLHISPDFQGEFLTPEFHRLQYATDASAYREVPVAVARPRNNNDIRILIGLARSHGLTLIPRTAGTSLAGQVVGNGIIVDVSRYMNGIIEFNPSERWIRVQPGVVLDELNKFTAPHGLFFGPETSTSNRCMIGGMVGNNACGSHSLVYGSTRDHLLEITVLLADGTEATFGDLTTEEFAAKCRLDTLEGAIYRKFEEILRSEENLNEIRRQYPDPALSRRNTGYALDLLLDTVPFGGKRPFNMSTLLAGSEGTLAFFTEIKLNLVPLHPPVTGLLCVHCSTLEDAFSANLVALEHGPSAIELMDHFILERTKGNIAQNRNRFFVVGDPAAILIVEFAAHSMEAIQAAAQKLTSELTGLGLGYEFPLVMGNNIQRVWALRKAGLGLLSNLPGDAKPVAVIEDTAVTPDRLPAYIAELKQMLASHELECVFYAHIATGELHLRPVLNLKDSRDVELFRTVAHETAKLVKKFRGSLSGEHGDGRLRGEFIPLMLGEKVYGLLEEIKKTWDPEGVFNIRKITGTPPMNEMLRFTPGWETPEIVTVFDFSDTLGFARAVEQCNGSGDCRKSELFPGVMCPSYQATREESATTRARANILREFLNRPGDPFDYREIYEVLDLCLSCKGCKSECPSNVDMTKYKAEYLQQWYKKHGIPLRTWLIGNYDTLNAFASRIPGLYNWFVSRALLSGWFKKLAGFAPERSLPKLYRTTLKHWYNANREKGSFDRKVYLFADEFTNYNDTEIGIKAIEVLQKLGYGVEIPDHIQSGRACLSKGMLYKAQKIARENIRLLSGVITEETPLIGIEPSALLAFRDEYIDLTSGEEKGKAVLLAENCLLFDEFISRELANGNIDRELFSKKARRIKLHGHCHQKSLASTLPTRTMLSIPENYTVEELKTGCCGMAGSFGMEKEHYPLSKQVAGLALIPAVEAALPGETICAPGTSCRQQINDLTGRTALHPVEIIWEALYGTD